MKRVYIVIDERTNLIVKVYNNRKKAENAYLQLKTHKEKFIKKIQKFQWQAKRKGK